MVRKSNLRLVREFAADNDELRAEVAALRTQLDAANETYKHLRATQRHLAWHAAKSERERIAGIASALGAVIPADHPPGAMASFADYIRTYGAP